MGSNKNTFAIGLSGYSYENIRVVHLYSLLCSVAAWPKHWLRRKGFFIPTDVFHIQHSQLCIVMNVKMLTLINAIQIVK